MKKTIKITLLLLVFIAAILMQGLLSNFQFIEGMSSKNSLIRSVSKKLLTISVRHGRNYYFLEDLDVLSGVLQTNDGESFDDAISFACSVRADFDKSYIRSYLLKIVRDGYASENIRHVQFGLYLYQLYGLSDIEGLEYVSKMIQEPFTLEFYLEKASQRSDKSYYNLLTEFKESNGQLDPAKDPCI